MAFEDDPYGLQNRGPVRQDVAQSWDMIGGGAPAPAAPAPAPQAQPVRLDPAQMKELQAQADYAVLGIRPEDQMRADALSRRTGQEISPLLVQAHTRHIPGQAGRAAGFSPTGRTTQTSGLMAPEAVDEMRERGTSRLALTSVAAEEKQKADMETARIQETEAQGQAQRSQQEYEQAYSKLDAKQKKLLSDMEAIATDRVDPGRIFAERGVVGSALSAIADAGSYYASAMLGRPFASQIQADIDRDIALQEGELERKKGQAQTELGILRQEFGDLDMAKVAMRAKQETYAIARLSRLAAEAQEPAVKAALQADLATMQEALGNTLTVAKYGVQNKSESEQFHEAQAATRGRDVFDAAGALADVSKSTGMTEKEVRADMQALGDKRSGADRMVLTLDEVAASNGLTLDPKSLRLTAPDGVAGYGFLERYQDGTLTEKGKATRQAMARGITSSAANVFGATNAVELQKYTDRMEGARTEEDFMVAANELLADARGRIVQTNASFAKPVVDAYDGRLRDELVAQRDRAKARAEAQQKSIAADREAGLKAPEVKEQPKPEGSYRGILGYRGQGSR